MSEKREYAYATGHSRRPQRGLNAEDISRLFRRVGWIGRKRTRDPFACPRCAVEGPHTHQCEGVDLVGAV